MFLWRVENGPDVCPSWVWESLMVRVMLEGCLGQTEAPEITGSSVASGPQRWYGISRVGQRQNLGRR